MASPYVRCKFAVSFTKNDAKRFSLKKDDILIWLILLSEAVSIQALFNWSVLVAYIANARFSLTKMASE